MTELYLEILYTARTTVIWEMILMSLFFLTVTVLVFFIPYQYKTKQGFQGTFLRMTAKWQLWVFKGCFASLLVWVCLWLNLERVDQIHAIDRDIQGNAVVSCQTEYAVEKPVLSFGNRRTIWISKDGEALSLIQYGSDLSSGDTGISTVIYGEHSGIVLSMGED